MPFLLSREIAEASVKGTKSTGSNIVSLSHIQNFFYSYSAISRSRIRTGELIMAPEYKGHV